MQGVSVHRGPVQHRLAVSRFQVKVRVDGLDRVPGHGLQHVVLEVWSGQLFRRRAAERNLALLDYHWGLVRASIDNIL